MAVTHKVFVQATNVAAGASASLGYTVPANTAAKISKAVLHNSHTAPVAVSIWYVPSGSSADATTKVYQKTMAVDETDYLPESTLSAGSTIHGLAGTASVVATHISGMEIV